MKVSDRQRRESGSTFVILAIFMVALFGFAGLSIDVSNVLFQRKKAHEATDSGALASVREWATTKNPSLARAMALSFCAANGLSSNEVLSVETGTWSDATKTFTGPLSTLPTGSVPAVRIRARRTVELVFAKVVGMSHMSPQVESIAAVLPAISVLNALPWAVCDTFTPEKCMTITLQFKDDGTENACSESGPLSGNFGQLTLPGGSGADWYQHNIENGYQSSLSVGQSVDTDPGVSWGPTKKGIDARVGGLPPYNCTATSEPPDNARLAIIPKVSSLDVSGKKAVEIIGFYVVSLDGYDNSSKSVTATFLEAYAGSEVNPGGIPTSGDAKMPALVR